jgi:hypothetical protein
MGGIVLIGQGKPPCSPLKTSPISNREWTQMSANNRKPVLVCPAASIRVNSRLD